jgi:citrate lyase subunit beta-like protein
VCDFSSVTLSIFPFSKAIHPNQIEVIYKAFQPPEEKYKLAQHIIEGNELHQSKGVGAFEIDGKMIDMPMVSKFVLLCFTSEPFL